MAKRIRERLYRRGAVWWAWFYPSGPGTPKVRRSTGCTDKSAALQVLAQWERDAAAERSDPTYSAARDATLSQALELLITHRTELADVGKRSRQTVQFYRQKAGNLVAFFGDAYPLSRLLNPTEIDRYVSKRRERNEKTGKPHVTENTIHKELVTLRAALKLAKRQRLWKGDLSDVIEPGFTTGYEPRQAHLSNPKEAMRLISELEREAGPGRAAAIAFSIATGAERAAIFRALRSDLADLRLVPVHGTKRKSRERSVPIVAPWQKRLLDHVVKNADGEDGLLFRPWVNARRGLLRACARAGVQPLTWNDLRRTYGVWMRKLGVAPALIAPTMGHKTSHMVETVYGRLAGEHVGEQMAEVIELTSARRRIRRAKGGR